MTFNIKQHSRLEAPEIVIDDTRIMARAVIFEDGKPMNLIWFIQGRFQMTLEVDIKDAEALQAVLATHIENIRKNEQILAARTEKAVA